MEVNPECLPVDQTNPAVATFMWNSIPDGFGASFVEGSTRSKHVDAIAGKDFGKWLATDDLTPCGDPTWEMT